MGIGQRIFERPKYQRQRRAKFVADIGEKLRLQRIELRQFLALARNFALMRLLLRDVAPLGCDEYDVALLILDGAERGVDDDGLLAAGASVDFRIPANEFALRSAEDRLPEDRPDLLRDLPPESCPKGLSFDVGEINPYGIERDLIDFEHRARGIQKPDELNHEVERDSRKFLPIPFSSITG
jgi:hypothetical protein